MHLRLRTALSILLASFAIAPLAHAVAPGDPVPGFMPLDSQLVQGSTNSSVTGVAYQPDGKLVASFGYFDEGLGFARFNADGVLDTSFATGGVFHQTSSLYVNAQAIAIDAQGRIVFAGNEEHDGAPDPGRIVVGRLTATGALDATFGTGGMVRYAPASTADAHVTNVFVHSDGSILVAGHMDVSGDDDLFGAKITSAGVFDTNYNADGVTSSGTTSDEQASDALMLPDGRLAVFGTRRGAADVNRGALLHIYGADGSLGPATFDMGRGTDDDSDPEPWSFTTGVVLGPDTIRLVEHRAATPYPLVSIRMAQYTLSGNAAALDTSFDGDGFGTDLTSQIHPTDMVRTGDGKFVLTGYDDRNAFGLKLVRISASGLSLDTSFATEGIGTYDIHDPQASYNPHVIEAPDGSLFVAGNHRKEFPLVRGLSIRKITGRIARVTTSITSPVTAPKVGVKVPIDVQVNAAGPDASGTLITTVSIPTNLQVTAPGGCVATGATSWKCASTGTATFAFSAVATAGQMDTVTATTSGSVYDDDRANDAASFVVTSTKRTVSASLKQLTRTKQGKLTTSTCGATTKKSCSATRVRRNVRLAAFQLRAAVAPVAERVPAKATISVQKLVKGKWASVKLTGKVGAVTIGKGNLGTWTLPSGLRTKAASLRLRVNIAASPSTAAASSAWRYIRVK